MKQSKKLYRWAFVLGLLTLPFTFVVRTPQSIRENWWTMVGVLVALCVVGFLGIRAAILEGRGE